MTDELNSKNGRPLDRDLALIEPRERDTQPLPGGVPSWTSANPKNDTEENTHDRH